MDALYLVHTATESRIFDLISRFLPQELPTEIQEIVARFIDAPTKASLIGEEVGLAENTAREAPLWEELQLLTDEKNGFYLDGSWNNTSAERFCEIFERRAVLKEQLDQYPSVMRVLKTRGRTNKAAPRVYIKALKMRPDMVEILQGAHIQTWPKDELMELIRGQGHGDNPVMRYHFAGIDFALAEMAVRCNWRNMKELAWRFDDDERETLWDIAVELGGTRDKYIRLH